MAVLGWMVPASAATLTVTTKENENPPAGQTSLGQALAAVRDGDTIAFNIAGAGPHYLKTPPGGYPIVRASRVTIDGFTQPGSSPNSNPILASNNAKLMIFLDSREGAATVLDFDGYGLSESAILPFAGANEVTVKGLGFLAAITAATVDAPAVYGIAFGQKSRQGHVSGCWFGIDADGRSVFGANAGITGFRFREGAESFLADGTVVGVKPGSSGPESQFNVFAGQKIPVILEASTVTIAGNFFGVLPSGTNEFNNAVAGWAGEGAIQIGRSSGPVVIGTDGDGINDANERNVFGGVLPPTVDPVNGYRRLIEFYGGGEREGIVIAGNHVGIGVDGKTRFTNGVPFVSGLTGTARIGADLDGSSDLIEGNWIFNHYPSALFTRETVLADFLENVGEGAVLSLRANRLVNNFTPPVSPLRDEGAFVAAYYSKAILDTTAGVRPTISTNATIQRLEGTVPLADTTQYPVVLLDLYLVDPEGAATGRALFPDEEEGWVQGSTYLGQLVEGSTGDLDPEPGRFSFDISVLRLAVGTEVTVTANYLQGPRGIQNIPTLTSLFSAPVGLKEAAVVVAPTVVWQVANGVPALNFTGVLQSAASVAGPWVDVANAVSPLSVELREGVRFYRARAR